MIPSRPGEYSFRFFGSIKGQRFDETYTSGEETFASPISPSSIAFPDSAPPDYELANRVEELDREVGRARESARLGVTGLALAAVALALALAQRRRRSTA